MKRIISILSANIFGQFCTVLIQFLGIPIFLNTWGQDSYGEWLMIIAIPTYLMVTGSGLGFISGTKLQLLIENNREEEAKGVFQSSWAMTWFICLAVLNIFIPLVIFTPINEWLNIKHHAAYDVKAVLVLFSIYIVFSLLVDLLTGVYRAAGRFGRGIFLTNLIRISEFVCTIVSVVLGADIILVAVVYLLVRLLGFIIMLFECTKLRWFSISFERASFSEIKSQFISMISFLGIPLSQALIIQGMTTIIGIRLGPSSVVVFTITRTLVNAIKQFASIIYSAILPEFSTSISSGNFLKARLLHRLSVQITLWFVLMTSILLYLFSDRIMQIWTGGEIVVENMFFLLMLLATILSTVFNLSSFVQASINKFSTISFVSVSNAIMCTVLTYLLASTYGLVSIPITLLIAETIFFFVVVKQSLRILKDPIGEFASAIFLTLPFKTIFTKVRQYFF